MGGPAGDALLAAHVDGELGRLVQVLGEPDRADASGQHPRALERHQPVVDERGDLVERGLDALPGVDRDRHEREVLGQRQQARRLEVVLDAEALDAAQDHAGLEGPTLVEVHERVAEERAAGAVALAEIGRQLQAVVATGHVSRRTASVSAARVASNASGITWTPARTGMKFVSPFQRGTTCRCRWSSKPAPATLPRFRPTLNPSGALTSRKARIARCASAMSSLTSSVRHASRSPMWRIRR